MKYILLAYTNVDAWSTATEEEMQAACEFYEQLGKELTQTGEAVSNAGLGHPAHTTTVRKQEGGPVATDGPFAEAKEVLVSFGIVDCESHDRAVEIAALVADATGDIVEVRPLMGDGGLEM